MLNLSVLLNFCECRILYQRYNYSDITICDCSLIRLELCHRLVHYYTELDSVDLYGSLVPGTCIDFSTSTPGDIPNLGKSPIS